MKDFFLPSRIDTSIADCASWTESKELADRHEILKDNAVPAFHGG